MHGSAPEALVLCHQAGRTAIEDPPFTKLPSLSEMVSTYEAMAGPVRSAPVACVAVNTSGLSEADAHASLDEVEAETGLPAGDVMRGDAPKLWDAIGKTLGL